MKRPRRPAKRKVAKCAPRSKKALTLDSPKARKGYALQWASVGQPDILATYLDAGWQYVKRCRGFTSKRGKIIFQGMVLLEIKDEAFREMRKADADRARKQMQDADELFQIDRNGRKFGMNQFPLVTESFMVSSAYEVVPEDADPVDVTVSVKLRLPRRLQDAAAALKMTIEEYAQARMSMYVRGGLGGLLLPAPALKQSENPDSVELHETGNFNLISRI